MKVSPRIGLSGFFTPLGKELGHILAQHLYNSCLRWFYMPSTEVEFNHRHESLQWVINIWHSQQCLWVRHEAVDNQYAVPLHRTHPGKEYTHLVILSSMLLGSRIKVGSTTRLRSAPGRSCEMMWERTVHSYQPSVYPSSDGAPHHFPVQAQRRSSPLRARLTSTHRESRGLEKRKDISNLSSEINV